MIVSLSHHMLLNFIKQSCELAQTKGDTVQIIGLQSCRVTKQTEEIINNVSLAFSISILKLFDFPPIYFMIPTVCYYYLRLPAFLLGPQSSSKCRCGQCVHWESWCVWWIGVVWRSEIGNENVGQGQYLRLWRLNQDSTSGCRVVNVEAWSRQRP